MSEELPAVAEARMAEIRRSGTWGSALTTDEFAAIRSVGFEPAGQVLGAAVYNIGYTGGYNCPGAWGSWGFGMPARTTTQVSSQGGFKTSTRRLARRRSRRRAPRPSTYGSLQRRSVPGEPHSR